MEQTHERTIRSLEDLAHFATVKRWIQGWEKQWGQEMPAREKTEKLTPLLALSQSLVTTPDEMIKQCVLVTKDGVRKISIKGRRFYWEQIKSVEGKGNRKAANNLRSFFIHNGIMMQAETQKSGLQ